VLPNAQNTGKTRCERGMQSYSQKSQITQLLGSGQPKVLPKEQTERLKLVAAAVAAISAPPPGRTHTGTTKGGALSHPDPGRIGSQILASRWDPHHREVQSRRWPSP
jgi:hypothetical protein